MSGKKTLAQRVKEHPVISAASAIGIVVAAIGSVMTATGQGAQAGVLIRDAESLELLASVDTTRARPH